MRKGQVGRSLSSKSWAEAVGALSRALRWYWVRSSHPRNSSWKPHGRSSVHHPECCHELRLIRVPFLQMVGQSWRLFLLGF